MNAVSFDAGTTAEENNVAINSEPDPGTGFIHRGFTNTGPVSNVTGSGTTTIANAVTLDPGDSIWLWAVLQCFAANGAVVNASLDTNLESTPVLPSNAHRDALKEN
jgi:hypothetical protein